MKKHPRLSQPGRIGSMWLKNRMIMPAMGTNFVKSLYLRANP